MREFRETLHVIWKRFFSSFFQSQNSGYSVVPALEKSVYVLHSKSSYLVALNEPRLNYRCGLHYHNPALRKLVMTTPFQLSSGHGKHQPY